MDNRRHQHGTFSFKIEKADNETLIASIVHHERAREEDSTGALYYVVVVILIYGCSILMMIASYIRKNKVDQRLNRYFKDMATVRKREEQLQLFNAATVAAAAVQLGSRLSPKSSQGDRETPMKKDPDMKDMLDLPSAASNNRTNLHVSSPIGGRSSTSLNHNQRRRKSSVRFVSEFTDIDSDSDVFLSPDPTNKLVFSHNSFLSPRQQFVTPVYDSDTGSRRHQSSEKEDEQESIVDVDRTLETVAQPESTKVNALQGIAEDQKDLMVVSTV